MKKKHWFQAAAFTSVIGLALSTAFPAAEGVSVGDEVSYTFRSPVMNGMGVDELSDFRGRPMLVEFWGTK